LDFWDLLLRQKLKPLEEGLQAAEKMADARQSKGAISKINDILITNDNKTCRSQRIYTRHAKRHVQFNTIQKVWDQSSTSHPAALFQSLQCVGLLIKEKHELLLSQESANLKDQETLATSWHKLHPRWLSHWGGSAVFWWTLYDNSSSQLSKTFGTLISFEFLGYPWCLPIDSSIAGFRSQPQASQLHQRKQDVLKTAESHSKIF